MHDALPPHDPVPPPMPAMPAPAPAFAAWHPLPDAAARVAMIGGAFAGLPVAIGLGVLGSAFAPGGLGFRLVGALLVLLLATGAGALLGRARCRHTTWHLDERGLHVRRGLVWRKEILVPRSRVQHLDLERGPVERHFGLATLVVHTAGTRLNALRQSGFLDEDAVAVRDALLPEAERHDDAL